ncbi:hypothetical protein V1509DRAFT_633649 [Lipomyces kononenkoae]
MAPSLPVPKAICVWTDLSVTTYLLLLPRSGSNNVGTCQSTHTLRAKPCGPQPVDHTDHLPPHIYLYLWSNLSSHIYFSSCSSFSCPRRFRLNFPQILPSSCTTRFGQASSSPFSPVSTKRSDVKCRLTRRVLLLPASFAAFRASCSHLVLLTTTATSISPPLVLHPPSSTFLSSHIHDPQSLANTGHHRKHTGSGNLMYSQLREPPSAPGDYPTSAHLTAPHVHQAHQHQPIHPDEDSKLGGPFGLRRPYLNNLPSLHLLNRPMSPPGLASSLSPATAGPSSANNLLTPPTFDSGAAATASTAPEAYSIAPSSSYPNNSSMSYWAAASSSQAPSAVQLGTSPSQGESPRRMSYSSTSSQYSLPSLSSTASSPYASSSYAAAAAGNNSAGSYYQQGISSYQSQQPGPLLPPPSSISSQSQQHIHSTPTSAASSSFIPSPPDYPSSFLPSSQQQQQPQSQQYYSDAYQPWSSALQASQQPGLVRRPSHTSPRSFDGRYPYPPPLTHLPPPPPLHQHIPQQQPHQVPPQERPFKCDQCPQSFNRNHDLKRHKRIHLDVKPFPCPNCDKTFSRKDALKRHTLVKGCGGNNDGSSNSNATAVAN